MNPLLAFFLSPLPKRYWGTASGVGILVSALFQAAISLTLGMQAYDVYAKQVGQALADGAVVAAKNSGAERVEAGGAMALAALTPVTFLAESPSGRLFAYGLLSAIFRMVGYASGLPCGDPILTIIDEVIWGIGESIRSTVFGIVARVRSLF